tara:strand:+ start:644 stop:1429 length:786 start_codon:yes stop_codon:yes gene_type:complete
MSQPNTTPSQGQFQAVISPRPNQLGTKATATVTIAAGNAADGDTVVLTDSSGTEVTFEFDDNASATGTAVTIGGDNDASATNLADAITASPIDMTAEAVDNVVTITQGTAGPGGNTTVTETGSNISKTDFAGGIYRDDAVIVERVGPVGDVMLALSNFSDSESMTVTVEEGDQNTAADYAAVDVIFNGSTVSSVTIPPNGTAAVTVPAPTYGAASPDRSEGAQGGSAHRFMRVRVTDSRYAWGQLVMTYNAGTLELRTLFA